MDLQLHHVQDLVPRGETRTSGTLVLGYIVAVHVRNAVLTPDGKEVDAAALRPIARLGGIQYARLGDLFEIERPPWDGDVTQVLAKDPAGKSGSG